MLAILENEVGKCSSLTGRCFVSVDLSDHVQHVRLGICLLV
jgi:hypothetical protein